MAFVKIQRVVPLNGILSGKEPGSGNRSRELWEPVLGTGSGFRWVPTGFAVLGSGSEGCVKEVSKVSVFDGFRGVRFCSRIKKVPGQGFRQLLCTSKVYSCTLKVYFCTLKVCFCTLKVYLLCFASILFYVESIFL